MKKYSLALLALLSTAVFAASPVVPNESFNPPSNDANKAKVTVPVLTQKSNETSNTTNSENKEKVEVKSEAVQNRSFTEIQGYSTQSTEEYMKRRNSTFQTGLSTCITQLPKNARGERSAEEMLKCANNKGLVNTSENKEKDTKKE